ncbi:trypsin-like peptidase domain-containing protein [Mycolicibacterium hippocampi]|uniref:trypsin-like peptidase domain-containing protein n=1 Tax=Mycolicibacterium hippocampi TaxID=659824 RepID=UPI0013D05A76|nr:trypsin-like peptidase domain-containing protein [Mycolicibacterium hippocampi]
MADGPEQGHRHLSAVTSGDALADQPAGSTLFVSPVDAGSVEAGAAPLSVTNWDIFDGALLAVGFKYGDTIAVDGTAVKIGLGLALSAEHVFTDHMEAIQRGEAKPYCFGLRSDGGADIWECYATASDSTGSGDLQLLGLRLVSDVPASRHFRVLPLTTRIPPLGEAVTVVGFRFDPSLPADSVDDHISLPGMMYVSKGTAGEFSHPIHDTVLAPYPTIEVLSGSHGGMSGGAVLDVNGHIIGVTSRGLQHDDHQGPTLAAWWMPAIFWRPELTWPPHIYEQSPTLWDMPAVFIDGRENVEMRGGNEFRLLDWWR